MLILNKLDFIFKLIVHLAHIYPNNRSLSVRDLDAKHEHLRPTNHHSNSGAVCSSSKIYVIFDFDT